jgi:hypothetical protein
VHRDTAAGAEDEDGERDDTKAANGAWSEQENHGEHPVRTNGELDEASVEFLPIHDHAETADARSVRAQRPALRLNPRN